jgi:hypothetical protein
MVRLNEQKRKTMKNNIQTSSYEFNLLNSTQFKQALKFEAHYANTVKGGHLPNYINTKQRERIVSTVNILTSEENTALISNLFIGKN